MITDKDLDDWKQSTPDDYEDTSTCKHCGDEIEEDKQYCSKSCYTAYFND